MAVTVKILVLSHIAAVLLCGSVSAQRQNSHSYRSFPPIVPPHADRDLSDDELDMNDRLFPPIVPPLSSRDLPPIVPPMTARDIAEDEELAAVPVELVRLLPPRFDDYEDLVDAKVGNAGARSDVLPEVRAMAARLLQEDPAFRQRFRRSMGMLRMGRSGPVERRTMGMLRMGRSGKDSTEEEKRSMGMLRMGRALDASNEEAKRSMGMLRMGRALDTNAEEKRSMGMLRMGRSSEAKTSEEAKRSMGMLRMGRALDTNAAEEKRSMGMLRMGRASDTKKKKVPTATLR